LSLIPKGHPNRGLFDVLAIASTVLALPLPARLGANKEDAHSIHLVNVPLRTAHAGWKYAHRVCLLKYRERPQSAV
jgi:hypothetical protein